MNDKVKEIVPKEDKCDFCGNKATLLCDRPTSAVINSVDFRRTILTCDKKICHECATRINGFDYCPDCIEKIRSAKKGVKHE